MVQIDREREEAARQADYLAEAMARLEASKDAHVMRLEEVSCSIGVCACVRARMYVLFVCARACM
jgi:hypothetical protein